jgi:xanthine dehydrogenase large subunit
VVAEALGLKLHQVVCECKRMGGGFGGKETQSAIPAVMASLVAHLTGRSARVVYRKDQDMIATGKRHAYKTWYRAAFTPEGKILAVDVRFYSNGGAFADLSTSVMERSMLHTDNAYFLPVARIIGQVCKMNYPPNTAFRGFGGPQGVAVIENILQEIALKVGRDAYDVRRLNAYRDGDPTANTTPYGQIVSNHVLAELFDRLETTSDYRRRMAEVIQWNAGSKTHVKGLAMSPIKFGISFTTKFLNQGNALVNVYIDGSVQVSSGGTEMGQGLNTKLRQIVADAFGIDAQDVLVMPTSTEKNHNTSPTAASAGTDLNGQAALMASQAIRERMAAYAATRFAELDEGLSASPEHIVFEDRKVFDDRRPDRCIGFGALCESARRERVDLGARGFYATPGVDFNRETGRGTPFYYFTTGAAVSEVTIDRFSGELTVNRVDVLMDLGQLINPAVDLGQVVGGFVQGMGWCTNEELVYDAEGKLLSTSPTTYKIPNVTDIPTDFHVNTLDNPKHRINVLQSKAVGEPPLMLGISVWLAIKHAISQLANDAPISLPIPATGEAILKALTDACKTSDA